MNILLLHGYVQNASIITKKIQRLLISSKKYKEANYISIDGTICVNKMKIDESDLHNNDSNEKLYGWWPIDSIDMITKPHEYHNIEISINKIKNEIENKDIDVVIGFSQGAVLASILLGHGIISCNKVVLYSGFDIMDSRYNGFNPISIPSLHFVGIKDELCNIEYSKKLMERYENPILYTHKWGHVIPSNSESKKQLLDFLN